MAKKITIPITDHADSEVCTMYYIVSYKLAAAPVYTQLPPYHTGSIEISNLLDDTEYNVKIIRFCCNGVQSAPVVLNVTTTVMS